MLLTGAYPEILDVQWIYLCASMSVFGGGAMGQIAMQFAMAGTITTKQNRYVARCTAAISQATYSQIHLFTERFISST
jgi:hypothetical protein